MCGEYTIEREWFYALWRDLFVHTVTLQNINLTSSCGLVCTLETKCMHRIVMHLSCMITLGTVVECVGSI